MSEFSMRPLCEPSQAFYFPWVFLDILQAVKGLTIKKLHLKLIYKGYAKMFWLKTFQKAKLNIKTK